MTYLLFTLLLMAAFLCRKWDAVRFVALVIWHDLWNTNRSPETESPDCGPKCPEKHPRMASEEAFAQVPVGAVGEFHNRQIDAFKL